ncbi:hypothetical protein OPV22_012128 [Ensete ventricosum]|uniref:RING-type domain-containing protein n=1 Tax=Ensete ventricosum TaxID=4639 RepID=A0AAV8R6D9_ENSVE|nr:hypothetical protein OPV22_012128 [Ensete ventricosum]RWV90600.1 hypothetical protein GW17_00047180 [Ensete ventricosum]RWW85620.1 hypothetical protein BHE74_00005686 [Ensete ventricosum]RZR85089.1 hypothetical protein BHM03_00012040 [Ensete ventricosum]
MGFPSVSYCVILPKPLLLVVQLVDLLKFVVSFTISCLLGLCPPQEDSAHPSPASAVHPSAIKRRLPIVEFSTPRSPVSFEGDEAVCAVCLGTLEDGDEVRELGNCCHAFHRLCIDKWVDVGRLTCPLCRTQLLPRGREEKEQLVMAVEFM